jgi:rfaE bifunctional protein kinase chain/domain
MNYKEIFDRFEGKRILVIGDVMIDSYVRGHVSRISPEAPVPIVTLEKEEDRLGGAANVAINLSAMGAKPIVCSVIGDDQQGSNLKQLLNQVEISDEGLVLSKNRKTTVKTRIIGNNQQLLRIDSEQVNPIDLHEENTLIQKVRSLIEKGIDGIIFEDYNKGVLTPACINEIISLANKHKIVTAVDPKKENFFAYKNVTLFKPNLKELKDGLGLDFLFSSDLKEVELAIDKLNSMLNNQISFVTLSEHGVFIKNSERKHYTSAHVRTIADVSGAGDTVISVATLCLVVGLPIELIAEISNIAGGLVCEKSGVVSIDKTQLLQETQKLLVMQ